MNHSVPKNITITSVQSCILGWKSPTRLSGKGVKFHSGAAKLNLENLQSALSSLPHPDELLGGGKHKHNKTKTIETSTGDFAQQVMF